MGIVCRVEGLCKNQHRAFFLSSLNIQSQCVLSAAVRFYKKEELQRPRNICFLLPFFRLPHTAAASLRVRITHCFLRIGDIVWV